MFNFLKRSDPVPKPLECPYCSCTKFFEGPSGGGSQNILCSNLLCRHWFNYSFGVFPLEDLHKVEPTTKERIKAEEEREIESEEERVAIFNEGQEIHQAGKSVLNCIKEAQYNQTFKDFGKASGADLLRLAGWIHSSYIRSNNKG